MKTSIHKLISILIILIVVYSCASIGRPDGGAYDETPPRFLGSRPTIGELNYNKNKLTLDFDEYIKLEKASEKITISPPQVQQPEIKASGKKVQINLLDSLKPNTTYTVDFSDAIVDNNEGNPLGNFTFTFSTGEVIDSMEVSGTVLDASNLEPIKGMMVGLHNNLEDSAFTTLPFERVGRTDSRGRFKIKGIAPGTYRIYGLQDADQNFTFNQKSEMIAFNDSLVIPSSEGRMHLDTIWRDSLTIDTVIEHNYTHYLPDDLILRAFKETLSSQYLVKSERLDPQKFTFYFANKADTLPLLTGLNFDEKDAFIIEKNQRNDTISYWIKDSLLYQQDTLKMSIKYLYTDTLNQLVPRIDTLRLVAKNTPKPKTESKKTKKSKSDKEEKESTVFLSVNTKAPSTMQVYDYISFSFPEPMQSIDTSAIHLGLKVDTLWQEVPFTFVQDSMNLRQYNLLYEWDFQQEFKLSVDSASMYGIYGLHNDKIDQSFKIRAVEEYSNIFFNVIGADKYAFVELLDTQDKVVRRVKVKNDHADFYFLNPGKYSARLINDRNNNGVWDTGLYEGKIQPEEVFYYPQILEPKANWELNQDWNVQYLPLDKQKPDELKKQKPDEQKKRNKNESRSTNRR